MAPVISGVSTNNSTGCMIIPAGYRKSWWKKSRWLLMVVIEFGNNNDMNVMEIITTGSAVDFGDASKVLTILEVVWHQQLVSFQTR